MGWGMGAWGSFLRCRDEECRLAGRSEFGALGKR